MSALPPTAVEQAPADWDSGLLAALYELVFAAPDREVAGVLVGQLAPAGTPLPQVRAAIPATQGFVTGQAACFTHDTWATVHATMAKHYAGLEAVGWYLSRPGRGTGLVPADVLNHGRWFAREGHILLIVDSQSHVAALYEWRAGQIMQITEGTVARRYTRAPRLRFPTAAVSVLGIIGASVGAVTFLISQALGG